MSEKTTSKPGTVITDVQSKRSRRLPWRGALLLIIGIVVGFAVRQAVDVDSRRQVEEIVKVTESSQFDDIQACDVLRQRVVARVVNAEVYPVNITTINQPSQTPEFSVCGFVDDRDQDLGVTRLTLLHFKGNVTDAENQYLALLATAKSANPQSIEEKTDLGDKAFWSSADRTKLTVLKGDTLFELVVGKVTISERTYDLASEIAKDILKRY